MLSTNILGSTATRELRLHPGITASKVRWRFELSEKCLHHLNQMFSQLPRRCPVVKQGPFCLEHLALEVQHGRLLPPPAGSSLLQIPQPRAELPSRPALNRYRDTGTLLFWREGDTDTLEMQRDAGPLWSNRGRETRMRSGCSRQQAPQRLSLLPSLGATTTGSKQDRRPATTSAPSDTTCVG